MDQFADYETERLILKPTNLKDAAFVMELLNTPKWLQFIGDRKVTDIKGAEDYINIHMLPVFKKNGFGNYTAIRKTDGVKIGCCGLYDRLGVEGVDIGFAFLNDFEGKGYAFESASKIMEIGINHFGLKQISAITNPKNIGSQKLIKKLNLKFIRMIVLPESEEELMLYEWTSN